MNLIWSFLIQSFSYRIGSKSLAFFLTYFIFKWIFQHRKLNSHYFIWRSKCRETTTTTATTTAVATTTTESVPPLELTFIVKSKFAIQSSRNCLQKNAPYISIVRSFWKFKYFLFINYKNIEKLSKVIVIIICLQRH